MYTRISRRAEFRLALLCACLYPCFGQSQSAFVVVSAADHSGSVAPQSQAAVSGSNVADTTAAGQVDASGQLSTELAGTALQICGESAGIVSVSPSQITFVVPGDLGAGQCPVVVTTNGRTMSGIADVRLVAPALFSRDGSGAGRASAVNAVTLKPDPFSVLTPENASADKGTRVSVFGTGFRNAIAIAPPGTNPGAVVYGTVSSAAGRSWPVAVEYIGPAPGVNGVDQVNIALPAAINGSGIVSFALTVDSVRSNAVDLNIASVSAPVVNGFQPAAGAPGSSVTIQGANFGTTAMLNLGRIAVSLRPPGGIPIAVPPDAVDSSQLRFTVPLIPQDASTFYSGPATLCVQVDSATTCSSDFIVTPAVLSSGTPGQTFLALTRSSLQSGAASLRQLGAVQVAQALSANIDSIVGQYATVVNSAASGNPATITFQQSDGAQASVVADAAFINRLDVIAASLQPILAIPAASATNSSTLQPSCLSSQEQVLQTTRDLYRQARSASAAIIRAAVLAPVTGGLASCMDTTTENCVTNARPSVTAGEATADILTGLLYYPLLATMAIEAQPVFLDAVEIQPANLTSSTRPAAGGTALLLPLGETAALNVQGHFVSRAPAQIAHPTVSQAVLEGIGGIRLPQDGDVAIAKCDVCLKILQSCPDCSAALGQLGNSLASDLGAVLQNNLYKFAPAQPSTQAQNDIPLGAGTLRIDPNGSDEVAILPACTGAPAAVTGTATTGGAYETFAFAADPGSLLLSSEIASGIATRSVFSALNVAVGPAAPPLGIQTDKLTYSNQEQAYVSGSGFPSYAAVAIAVSNPQFTEKVLVTAFADGSGRFGVFTPLNSVLQTGSYTLSAFVPNSSIRVSVTVSITATRLLVQVSPQGANWTASPQTIYVTAPGAQRIYYSVNQASGSIPAIPPAPSAISNDGVIDGPSGSLQLPGADGQLTAWIYRFTAEDGSGLGSASPGYVFTIDLRPSVATPQISGIQTTPDVPTGTQAFNFLISGTNFDAATAQVTFNGQGCPAGCTIANGNLVKTSTQLYGSVKLPGGSYTVVVRNGSSAGSNSFPLAVAFGTPLLAGISTSPNSAARGQAFDFTITGNNFDPNSAMVQFAGPGCTVSSPAKLTIANRDLSSKSPGQLSGALTLADGCYNVTVQNGSNGTPSNTVRLTVIGARISGMTVSPNPPVPGQVFSFSISGANFDPNSATVVFTGPGCTQVPNPCAIPSSGLGSATSTQLSGTAILNGGSYTVAVQNGPGGTPSNSLPFIVGTPQLTAITPATIVVGQTFAFTITGTVLDPSSVFVTFKGPGCTPCTVANSALTSKSSTSLGGPGPSLAAGSYTVAVQNGPGGAVSNSLSFTVSNPPPPEAPQVTAISTTPNAPSPGQAFTFTITGSGFDPKTVIVNFAGVNASNFSLTKTSATELDGTATLPAGTYTVTVQNGSNGTASNSLTLTVAAGSTAPQITSINPTSGTAGQVFTFTITGTGFDSNSALVNFTGGTATGLSLTATSATQLTGSVTLGAGSYTVTVQNGQSGTASNGVAVTIASPAGGTTPQLTSISTSPTAPTGGQAFTFTITGTGFDPKGATVFFNGPGCGAATTCSIPAFALTTATSTQLSGPAILEGGTFVVTVVNGPVGNISNGLNLVVGGRPLQITGMTPASTASGLAFAFTITGNGFDPGSATVLLSGPGCTTSTCTIANSALTSTSSTSLSGQGPALSSGSYTVTVQNTSTGASSNSWPFTVSTSGGTAPQLSSLSTVPNPAVDQQAFTLTITGSGFDTATAFVSLSGPGCSPTPCTISNAALTTKTATQVSGPITLGAGSFTATVQNGSAGAASNGLALNVGPRLTAIAPNSATAGTAFTFVISGSGFDPNSALVTITGPNCAPCTILNSSLSGKTSTALSGNATLTAAGSYTISVQNGASGAASNTLAVTVSSSGTGPQVTTFATTPDTPSSQTAFTFTVTGTGFDPATAVVMFSGPGCTPCTVANASLTSKSTTQLTGPVTLASSGSFTVTVQNGASGAPSNGKVVSVLGAAPQISSISPTSATAGQSFTFTINGSGFDPSNVIVNFTGGTASNLSLTTKTATQLAGTVTLTAGSYTVTAQNGSSGAASNGATLTVAGAPGAPQITSINPTSATAGQSFTFTISGSGFDPATVIVNFTGGTATGLSLTSKSSTQLSGTVTLGAGTYTVTAQNGSTGAASNGVTVTVPGAPGAPQITSINPTSATAGQSFTFTISGSGFDPNSVLVNFTGGTASNLSLATKSATQLVGTVTLTAGSYTVTVQNGSSGTASNSVSLTVSSSSGGGGPQLTGLSGGASQVHGQLSGLILFGSGFDSSSSQVVFNGPSCTPSVCTVSNVTVNGSNTAIIVNWTPPAAGNFTVQVRNGSGGTLSNSLPVTVQ